MRCYLDYSSVFDNPINIYDIDLFKKVIKDNGGKNIRTSNNYGWSNQPKVVTFEVNNAILKKVRKALNTLPVFEIWGCIIRIKDW